MEGGTAPGGGRWRLLAAVALLSLLTPACFLRSVSGRVDSVGEVIQANIFTNATVAYCREAFGEFECTYSLGQGSDIVSTAELIEDFGLFGVIVDPLVLQVPDDVGAITGTFNHRGVDEPLVVTRTDALDADDTRRIVAEPGHVLVVLDLPDDIREPLDALEEDERLEVDFEIRVEMPRLEPLRVKPLLALRVDVGGRSYYPPMLPCTTDLSTVPEIEVPVADDPEFLLDDLADAAALVQPCEGERYVFGAPERVERIAGADRIATSIEVSRATYPRQGQAAGVVLARADEFADALAATPFAWRLGAPILLTAGGELDPRVAEEIQRAISPDLPVYVVGGEAAVSPAVVAQVEALGYEVTRVGGVNRFATAVALADFFFAPAQIAYVADGGTFQAALLSGAAAAGSGLGDGVVLLTSGADMAPETAAWLSENPDAAAVAVGDAAVAAAPDADAIPGGPYELSVALADRVWGDDVEEVFLASGTVFADGLSAGPLSGPRSGSATYTGGPLLLTDPEVLPGTIEAWLQQRGAAIQRAAIIGGPVAVSDAVQGQIAQALGPAGDGGG